MVIIIYIYDNIGRFQWLSVKNHVSGTGIHRAQVPFGRLVSVVRINYIIGFKGVRHAGDF